MLLLKELHENIRSSEMQNNALMHRASTNVFKLCFAAAIH